MCCGAAALRRFVAAPCAALSHPVSSCCLPVPTRAAAGLACTTQPCPVPTANPSSFSSKCAAIDRFMFAAHTVATSRPMLLLNRWACLRLMCQGKYMLSLLGLRATEANLRCRKSVDQRALLDSGL